jgi:DNA-binding CsgD family transcriptional regulator
MEIEKAINAELDLPPEYCQYQDEGCDLASSCLACPFPGCIYEEPRGRQRLIKSRRDREEIVRLFKQGERGVRELARLFGVSQRTIQRALRNQRISHSEKGEEAKDEQGI